jgi:predicted MPP superfamily phosphohydrolase
MASDIEPTAARLPYDLPADRAWIASAGALRSPKQRRNRFSMDRGRVTFSRPWLGLGALSAAAAGLGVWQYGLPAAMSLGVAAGAGLAYVAAVEPGRPRLERVDLRLPALPPALEGLRIGQISDIHLGLPHTAANLAWAIAQMRQEQPDVIVITGDSVHYHTAIPRLAAALRALRAPLGVYAVTGNHDHSEGVDDLAAAYALAGVELLRNENRRLAWGGGALWLAGIDDLWEGRPDLDAALRAIPAGAPVLLLSHAPDHADEAARAGVLAQLSGHTHGGHIRLPLLGPYARPRYGVRYVMGHYTIGTMALYVSRGLGGAPLRFLCRPEATVVRLRAA